MRFLETRVPAPVIAAVAGASMKWYTRSHGIAVDPCALRMHLGVALSQLSAVVALAAVAGLWHARTTIDPLRPHRARALVTTGVFRYTRNPMYLSLLILLVAYAIRIDSIWVWLGPLFFLAYVTKFQVIPEERALLARFGEAFAQYRCGTRRWL